MVDFKRINEKIVGRKEADTLLDLVDWEEGTPDKWEGFWERLKALAEKNLPKDKEKQRLICMNDAEAKQFEKTAIGFGKYVGDTIEEIAAKDKDYLYWLSDVKDPFKDDLKRWLKNKSVSEHLEEEEIVSDPELS